MNFKTFSSLILVLLLTLPAMAQQWAITAGISQSDPNDDSTSNLNYDGEIGLEIGTLYYHSLHDKLDFRTGALLVQRNGSATSSGVKIEVEYMHLDIPVTGRYMITDKFGLMGGLELGLKLSDDCTIGNSDCTTTDAETLIFDLILGGHFAFKENMGIDIQYAMALTDIDTDLSINRAGASFVYKF